MSTEESSKKQYKMKRPPLAFLVCLGLSFVVWIFIKFSKEYTVTIPYQLVCEDIPENKKTVTCSDSVLQLTFVAKGVHFLNPKYAESKRQINLSVNEITKNSSRRNVYTFNKKALADYLRSQEIVDQYFIEVKTPESITIYLK